MAECGGHMGQRNFSATNAPRARAGQRLGDQPVSQADLLEMAVETDARTFNISAPALGGKDTAIHGRLNNVRCRSGLYVHATDTVEAHDLAAEWDMPPACSVAVMLEGKLEVCLDDVAMHLGPEGQEGNLGPTGHIWSITEPARLTRRSQKGMRVRKVIVTVPWEWIERVLADNALPNQNLETFARSHRANMAWRPSPHAISLAEQIVNPSRAAPTLVNMSVESRAIEIVREALESIIADAPDRAPNRPTTKTQKKAQSVRDYINTHLAENPSLKTMSKDLGMSVSTMQEAFKEIYGRTIADYLRELRLQRARKAIERDDVSVAQAAYEAGYSNPANFSTAFKRLFGLSPSDVRG